MANLVSVDLQNQKIYLKKIERFLNCFDSAHKKNFLFCKSEIKEIFVLIFG